MSVTTEDNLRRAYKEDNYCSLLKKKEVIITASLYGMTL